MVSGSVAAAVGELATHGGYDEDDLTRRQLRRVKGFARANDVPLPDLEKMTPREAERFAEEQAARFKEL